MVTGQVNGQQMSAEWYQKKAESWERARSAYPECAIPGPFKNRILEIDAWWKVHDQNLYLDSNKPFLLAQIVWQEFHPEAVEQRSEVAQPAEVAQPQAVAQPEAVTQAPTVQPQQAVAQYQSTGDTGLGVLTDSALSKMISSNIIIAVFCVVVCMLYWIFRPRRKVLSAVSPCIPAGGFASFGIRVVAAIIDVFLVFAVEFAIGYRIDGTTPFGTLGGFLIISPFVLNWLYYALFESSPMQATLGKMACGILVTDLQGGRVGFWQASVRFFGMLVSNITFFIGYLMCAWTEKKQCLHDMMAGCLVLKKIEHKNTQLSTSPPLQPSPAIDFDAESRLVKLKALFDKDLISKEDYDSKRMEILTEM